MAKIGILTFHKALNYGAVLQAFGIQEYLLSQGHDAYIIDYNPGYISIATHKFHLSNWLSKSPFKTIYRLFTEPFLCTKRIKRINGFGKFASDYYKLLPYTPNMNYTEFDYLFLGSDQIWNPQITGGNFDSVFWGEKSKCEVVSYAASSRMTNLTQDQIAFVKTHLKKIKCISVREKSLKDLLQPYTSKDISVVLDPTLLVGKECYKKIANPKSMGAKYILIYEVDFHQETIFMAQQLASKLHLSIIELVGNISFKNMKYRNQTASPQDFIAYIRDAFCVITSSFHGTALSILFNKSFYAIRQNNSADERIRSLLYQLNLLDRFVSLGDTISFQEIDYCPVEKTLSVLRKESEIFISSAIN